MKILSIDPGSSIIKIVESHVAFRSFSISRHEAIYLPFELPSESSEANEDETSNTSEKENSANALLRLQADAVKDFLTTNDDEGARLVWTLPAYELSFRHFSFPFKDKKKITKALPFQLEDNVPYEVDDVAIDYAVFPKKDGQSHVFCSYLLKDRLREIIEIFNERGLDPQVVIPPFAALRSLAMKQEPHQYRDQDIGILDLGHDHTSLHVFSDGIPVLGHVTPQAGKQITEEIAQAYRLDLTEAERIKKENAFLLPPQATNHPNYTEEQVNFSATISMAMRDLVRDIRHTLIAFHGKNKKPVDAIYITGGTSLISGIAPYLSASLGVAVQPLSALQDIPLTKSLNSKLDSAIYPVAVGAGFQQAGKEDHSALNFRRGEFSRKGVASGLDLSAFSFPASRAAAILALILLTFGTLSLVRGYQIESAQKQLIQALSAHRLALTDEPLKVVEQRLYAENPERVQSVVQKRLSALESAVTEIQDSPDWGLLPLIQLSEDVPPNLKFDLLDYSYEAGNITLAMLLGPTTKASAVETQLKKMGTLKLTDFKTSPSPQTPGRLKAVATLQD